MAVETKNQRITRIPIFVLAIVALCICGTLAALGRNVSSWSKWQDKPKATPPLPRFRYVIVNNGLLHNGRLVHVLMEPRAFSEENLKELFKLVSKRFPDPEELHIGAFTSLEQLPTPEEEDYGKSEEEDSLPFMAQIERYPGAVYTRVNGNEAFRYSVGNGRLKKTVVLKGKDPFEKEDH